MHTGRAEIQNAPSHLAQPGRSHEVRPSDDTLSRRFTSSVRKTEWTAAAGVLSLLLFNTNADVHLSTLDFNEFLGLTPIFSVIKILLASLRTTVQRENCMFLVFVTTSDESGS